MKPLAGYGTDLSQATQTGKGFREGQYGATVRVRIKVLITTGQKICSGHARRLSHRHNTGSTQIAAPQFGGRFFIADEREKASRGIWKSTEQRERDNMTRVREGGVE